MANNLIWVNKKDKKRVEEVSKITGLKYSQAFGIFSKSIPIITNSEIIRQPKSRKKRIRLTFVQEFDLPQR